jgi:sialidase-1
MILRREVAKRQPFTYQFSLQRFSSIACLLIQWLAAGFALGQVVEPTQPVQWIGYTVGHCAMHGHWQPICSEEKAGESNPSVGLSIVTVGKSTAEFTRKSEGDVIELDDGRLLLIYMEFSGDGSDFARTRLVAQESSDGGFHWHRHRVITETLEGDMNVYSPNLIRALDGDLLLVFMRQHGHHARTGHVWKSIDQGQSFLEFAEFFPKQEFSVCNATLKRLKSGRLLLPTSPPVAGHPSATGPYNAVVLYSDDDGKNWQASPTPVRLDKRGAMEPHVEQTGDGRVLMVLRNQLGKLYFSESHDDGATWSTAWSSALESPESCPELTRIPGGDDLLLIWNHTYDPSFRSHFGKRSPLTAAISKDHGETWQHLRNIETDSSLAFSNPGCRFTRDGKAIVNYWTCEYLSDWRMQDVIDLRVAIVDPAWFYAQESPVYRGRMDESHSNTTPR